MSSRVAFDRFCKATGNSSKAAKMWHAVVKYFDYRVRSEVDAKGCVLPSANLRVAATIGAHRIGLSRSDYGDFVKAVNKL